MLQEFDELRPLLFGIAYRMLGSVADAEDLVQEAFLRWREQDVEKVRSPKAFLTTVITRLCIDHLKSAKVQREEYIGPWLPEPIDGTKDARMTMELSESLSMAFLVVLESLNPVERAVFLLREVFNHDFDEIAAIVQKSAVNCRQIASRAKEHVASRRPRFEVTTKDHEHFVEEFMAACASGNLDGLMSMMTAEVVATSDGGGKTLAARRPIVGPYNVGRFLIGILKKAPAGISFRTTQINGQAGIVVHQDGQPKNVITFDIVDGQLQNLYLVVTPDKLGNIT